MGCGQSNTKTTIIDSQIEIIIPSEIMNDYNNYEFVKNFYREQFEKSKSVHKQMLAKQQNDTQQFFEDLDKINVSLAWHLFINNQNKILKEQIFVFAQQFNFSPPHLDLILECSPLRQKIVENQLYYKFMHKYFFHLYITQGVLQDIQKVENLDNLQIFQKLSSKELELNLCARLLNSEKIVIQMLGKCFNIYLEIETKNIKDILLQIVFSSKQTNKNSIIDSNLITAAANAMTLLNSCNISLSYINFSYTRIKGAILNDSSVQNSQFDYADMREVSLVHTNFDDASFIGTDMRGVNFGLLPDLIGHKGAVNCLSSSYDGNYALSGSEDKSIILWYIDEKKKLKQFLGHTDAVLCIKFAYDGKLFASGSKDKTIRIWQIKQTQSIQTLQEHQQDVITLDISFDNQFLVSGSKDTKIILWSLQNFQKIGIFSSNPKNCVTCLRFSNQGDIFSCGFEDGSIKFLSNDKHFKEIQHIKNKHQSKVTAICFDNYDQMIASCSEDKSLQIFQRDKATEVFSQSSAHHEPIFDLDICPENRFIATCSADKQIKIWSIHEKKLIKILEGHQDKIKTLKFIKNGKMIISGSQDNKLKLWKIVNEKSQIEQDIEEKVFQFTCEQCLFQDVKGLSRDLQKVLEQHGAELKNCQIELN